MSLQEERAHYFRRDVLGAVLIAVLVSAVCVVMHHFSSTPDKNDAPLRCPLPAILSETLWCLLPSGRGIGFLTSLT